MSEQKKMNKALFIVLLIVFFPAAIVYAIVCNKKPQEGPIDLTNKTGFITSLVGAGIWTANGLYNLIFLSLKVDATSGFMFGLPGVILGAGLVALVLLGKNKKLFSIIYLALTVALVLFCLISGWSGYYFIAVIGSIVGIFGGIRAIKYNAWLEKKDN